MMKKSKEKLLKLLFEELLTSGFYQVDELVFPIHLKILILISMYFLNILQVLKSQDVNWTILFLKDSKERC